MIRTATEIIAVITEETVVITTPAETVTPAHVGTTATKETIGMKNATAAVVAMKMTATTKVATTTARRIMKSATFILMLTLNPALIRSAH